MAYFQLKQMEIVISSIIRLRLLRAKKGLLADPRKNKGLFCLKGHCQSMQSHLLPIQILTPTPLPVQIPTSTQIHMITLILTWSIVWSIISMLASSTTCKQSKEKDLYNWIQHSNHPTSTITTKDLLIMDFLMFLTFTIIELKQISNKIK